jgi:anthranilate synthase component 2
MNLLLLDNYDSFTWNLYQYLEGLGARVRVELNDRMDPAEILSAGFDAIVISPGPGRPESAGICLDLIPQAAGKIPILGVCLGHQAIAQCYGARIVKAPTLMHGKTSRILHDGSGVFDGIPEAFEATRYHSLVVDPSSIDPAFVVNAHTDDGVVMGFRHRTMPLHGVQFHPESILTLKGQDLLANFLELAASFSPAAH